MPTLTLIQDKKERKINFEGEVSLSALLEDSHAHIDHPCGGKGSCRKCTVTVNGRAELACQYILRGDATVILPDKKDIVSVTGTLETDKPTENLCLCLDIGTTTLALALVSLDEGHTVKALTSKNPQRAFGADVISRIDYCTKNGAKVLQECLIQKLREMISSLLGRYNLTNIPRMYVAGNTTMLHLFLGVDCSSIGVSPYTPAFLGGKRVSGDEIGLSNVGEIITLPNISAFVGSDIVAGLGFVGTPEDPEKYSLLIDLGTNAEIVLFGRGKYLAVTAAAGPCFEGANISCGMSASDGAIYAYDSDKSYSVIGGGIPTGLCATGLIDLIATLVRENIIDESGYMENEEFPISDGVSLTREDVREFQLAKSAVMSALQCLIRRARITFDDIEKMYVAGGFSAKMNIDNASFLGLLPSALADAFEPINNSSLLGAIKFALGSTMPLEDITSKAEFIDLGADKLFSELFFENMAF